MSRLRIALVSEHASPLAVLGGEDAGGQNVFVAALATELARAGHAVTVYTRRDSTELDERVPFGPGVLVEHVPAGPARVVPKDELYPHMRAFSSELVRRWSRARPDVVHAHFWMSGIASAAAAHALQLPVVQTFHALGIVKRRHQGAADTSPPQRLAAERRLLGEVAAVVATCRDEVGELRALGADLSKVHVAPCGVDVSLFRPEGPVEPRPPGVRRLVAVTRLVPRKGIEDVIRALALLGPDVELVIAGGAPLPVLGADEEACRLAAIARQVGVAPRVAFRGALARPEVAALLRSADVALCVPWYEPFGIVPLEAMACGVPVVGTAVGGLLDSVADGVTGRLVPVRSPSAIAAGVTEIVCDAGLRARMAEAAVRRVREHYTWPRVAARTLDVYEAVRAIPPAVRAVSA